MTNSGTNVYKLFAQQADRHAEAIAVEDSNSGKSLSYQQLKDSAAHFAAGLLRLGVKAGDKVGLLQTRGVSPYIAIVGLLKIGAAYVALDPQYPSERIRFILRDTDTTFVITDENHEGLLANSSATPLIFDRLMNCPAERVPVETHVSPKFNDTESLCYVIYTSGSTGNPKGVGISQRNLLTYIAAIKSVYGVRQNDRILQGFSLAFDASVEELWMAWANGATLVVGSQQMMRSVDELPQNLEKLRISCFSTVPSVLSAMAAAKLPKLRMILFGGEAATAEIVKKWSAPGRLLFNGYGPTECTVVSTYLWCEPSIPVTIGRALPNYQTLVVGEALEPVPAGSRGELCVGGDAVSSVGYLNRPELNAQKFFERDGTRFYRTGDLVEVNGSGDLVFHGRIDAQVKIRGYRVELEEIESQLISSGFFENATVAWRENQNGSSELVAYLWNSDGRHTENGQQIDREELLQTLRKNLPQYMLPHHYVWLNPAALPRLTSGKVDRKRLPARDFCVPVIESKIRQTTRAPDDVSELEQRLLAIFGEALKREIPREASFFDYGGDSLSAAGVVSDCRKENVLPSLTIRDLYKFPSVCQLAEAFELSGGWSDATKKQPSEKSDRVEGNLAAATTVDRVSQIQYLSCCAAQILTLLVLFCSAASFLYLLIVLDVWIFENTEYWAAYLIAIQARRLVLRIARRTSSRECLGCFEFPCCQSFAFLRGGMTGSVASRSNAS